MSSEHYREKCLSAKGEECVECNATTKIVVHHIDGDRTNDSFDNLVPMCRSCHTSVHAAGDGFEHWTEELPELAIRRGDIVDVTEHGYEILRVCQRENDRVNPLLVRQLTGLPATTVQTSIDRLCRWGYVQQVTHGLYEITEKGKETVTETMQPDEFDEPGSRGYEWQKRSTEIKERDGGVCQRCGDHNNNYDHFPLAMNTHHIVPGKYLPQSDARVDLNLVTLCTTCHGRLEGMHVERQLEEIGCEDALRILDFLKGRRRNVRRIARELELPESRVKSLVDQLERMSCIEHIQGRVYRAVCPATAHAAAAKYKMQMEQGRETV